MLVRLIAQEETGPLFDVLGQAFGWDPKPEHVEVMMQALELDRTFAAYDGGRLVGTGGAYTLELTVPGGVVPCGGTTIIAVLPTHRRRGVLTEMMRFHLDEVASRGEPVAALWASEAPIYGRFGYGSATTAVRLEFERNDVSFAREPLGTGSVRLLDPDEPIGLLPGLYERIRPQRPGFVTRSEGRWQADHLYDPADWRNGASSRRWVVYEEEGSALGFVSYRQHEKWTDGLAVHRVSYYGLMALSPAAEDGLWRYLTGLDLTKSLDGWNSDPNAMLPWLVADARRIKRRPTDGLWVRILDVPGALTARGYRSEEHLVLGIDDPFRGSASGTFLLRNGPDGAICEPTSEPADVQMDVRELGSVYLGGVTFRELGRAGLIAGSEDALDRADRLFGWHVAPWCPEVF